jgi:hypothetical protein
MATNMTGTAASRPYAQLADGTNAALGPPAPRRGLVFKENAKPERFADYLTAEQNPPQQSTLALLARHDQPLTSMRWQPRSTGLVECDECNTNVAH